MMAKPCERCRRVRYQVTLIFGLLILMNFFARSLLNLEIKTIYDLLLLPSALVLILSVFVVFFSKQRFK